MLHNSAIEYYTKHTVGLRNIDTDMVQHAIKITPIYKNCVGLANCIPSYCQVPVNIPGSTGVMLVNSLTTTASAEH